MEVVRLMRLSVKAFVTTLSLVFCASIYADTPLTPFNQFGDNPGELSASLWAGEKGKPLFVLLHGCGQNGEVLAKQTDLLAIANAEKFSVLVPQQSDTNNIKLCFNWFSSQDIDKDQGELLSLKNMIDTAKKTQGSEQVYLVGLSAGGAMSASLAATYPELFNGVAIIAGIPHGCADNLIKAIACMRNGPAQSTKELVAKVSSDHAKWPPLSIWVGAKDQIVHPNNGSALAQQWAQLTAAKPNQPQNHQAYSQQLWLDNKGKEQVELLTFDALDHGIMVNPQREFGGETAPFVLAAPLATMRYLTHKWLGVP